MLLLKHPSFQHLQHLSPWWTELSGGPTHLNTFSRWITGFRQWCYILLRQLLLIHFTLPLHRLLTCHLALVFCSQLFHSLSLSQSLFQFLSSYKECIIYTKGQKKKNAIFFNRAFWEFSLPWVITRFIQRVKLYAFVRKINL